MIVICATVRLHVQYIRHIFILSCLTFKVNYEIQMIYCQILCNTAKQFNFTFANTVKQFDEVEINFHI